MNPHEFKASEIFMNKPFDQAFEEMKQFKLVASPADICHDKANRGKCLELFIKEAYSYEFDERPQYGVLKAILENAILEEYALPDTAYSWMQNFFGFSSRNTV